MTKVLHERAVLPGRPSASALSQRGFDMKWIILALVYLAIGVGVFVWYICSSETIGSDQKRRSMKILVLFPELCLFWPVALFFELKRRKEIRQVAKNHM